MEEKTSCSGNHKAVILFENPDKYGQIISANRSACSLFYHGYSYDLLMTSAHKREPAITARKTRVQRQLTARDVRSL